MRRRVTKVMVGLVAGLALALTACGGTSAPASTSSTSAAGTSPAAVASRAGGSVARGGQLVVSLRAEPPTFNRYVRRDATSEVLSTFLNAKLVRINRLTQEVEPWLAERWTRSDDGRRYTLMLRDGLTFSDGHAFSADDVVFSFDALYDEKAGNILAEAMKVGGKPLKVTASDPRTVTIEFPEVFAPGLRLLDNLPILPKHKLQPALMAGQFAAAWGVGTMPSEIVGLGPFVLESYTPGQQTVLVRNPHYFRKDDKDQPLPYLDRVVFQVVPDQNGELLRLEAGEIDATSSEVRPDDYAPLKRAADAGKVQLLDLGVGYDADALWLNLKPDAFKGDPRAAWIQRDEFRQAISYAVDRQQFADTVYLGAAVPVFGPITPANKTWYSAAVPPTPHDPAKAKALLESIGLRDRNGDGRLEDERGTPVRFTVLTQKGRTLLERGAAVIRDDLAKIGVTLDVVPLEGGDLIQRFAAARQYDAVYFTILTTDTDPGVNPDFWMSRGSAHIWNHEQAQPATDWERRIDRLMDEQTHTTDAAKRQALFAEVQAVFAEHLPMIHFAAPKVYVAASSRVTHVTPALLRPQLLWAPDIIAVRP